MKRKNTLFLLWLIFFPLNMMSETGHSNLLGLFNNLINCHSEQKMSETCVAHSPVSTGQEDGFQVYTYSDGTVIFVMMENEDPYRPQPVVKICTTQSLKTIEKMLDDSGYRVDQKGKAYHKGTDHSPSIINCRINKNKSQSKELIFTKTYNI